MRPWTRSHSPLRILGAAAAAALLLMGVLTVARAPAVADASETYDNTKKDALVDLPTWPKELLDKASALPVQDAGRIKPLYAWARFRLMQIAGRSSYKPHKDAKSRSAMEWFFDTLLYPDRMRTMPYILIADDQVLANVGVKVDGVHKKRDRYSYDELQPGREALLRKAAEIRSAMRRKGVKRTDFTPAQLELERIDSSLLIFESLWATGRIAFAELDVSAFGKQGGIFAGYSEVPALAVFERLPELAADLEKRVGPYMAPRLQPKDSPWRAFDRLRAGLADLGGATYGLAFLPPPADVDLMQRWVSVGSALSSVTDGSALDPRLVAQGGEAAKLHESVGMVLQGLAALRGDREDFSKVQSHWNTLQTYVVDAAQARGEYEKIELEVSFYQLDPFFKALMAYVLAFVLLAFTWLKPGMKWLYRAAVAVVILALVIHVVGITMRCIIRGRPPVLTLYETVLFISACAVLACLAIEWLNKQRIAIVLAVVLGAIGLWMAGRYEVLDKKDTISPVQAVLDTNFWLSTHVTSVTMGYAAGLLAAAVAHVHVLGRIFGLKRGDKGFYRTLSRMTYGMLCFGLLFSVVGTILGGIWANDSWGRFWGWDPKENGALMIVLWELAILHARMGGYIKQHGIAMAAVATGPIVAFSWWHVNLLGVGLHSYGFTEGVMRNLNIFYAVEVAVLLGGFAWWLMERSAAQGGGPAAQGGAGTPEAPNGDVAAEA